MPKKTKKKIKKTKKTSKEMSMLNEPEKLISIKSKPTNLSENAAQDIVDDVTINPPEKLIKKQVITDKLSRKDFEKIEAQDIKIAAQKELEDKKKAEDLRKDEAIKKIRSQKPGLFSKLKSVKLLDKPDSQLVKKIFFYVLIYGFMLNLVTNVVFGFPITIYSWTGWGLFLWFIENKFIGFIRKLFIK